LSEAKNCIVLGRFQPFHKGHEQLVLAAQNYATTEGLRLVLAIGSAQCGYEPMNPWTIEERKEMIQRWMDTQNIDATVVAIEDIHDAQRWVEHAEHSHGKGILYSSDGPTLALYQQAGWNVQRAEYAQRDAYEGWRVRQTMRMLSTVDDQDAIQMVLDEVLPKTIASWMIENDALFRLSTFETGVHAG